MATMKIPSPQGYAEAVSRLMTICPQDTPEARRIHAEWIMDGIVLALFDYAPALVATVEMGRTS